MKRKHVRTDGAVDWKSVHDRMAAALRLTEHALAPPPGKARQILDERARVIARPANDPPDGREEIRVVPFGARGRHYLLEARYFQEALLAPTVVPLPRTPDFLVGIVNIRGDLVPMFDLQVLYGAAEPLSAAPTRGAVLGESRAEFAVRADWIEPAAALPAGDILKDATMFEVRETHVTGMTADGRIVLDGAALMSEPQLFI